MIENTTEYTSDNLKKFINASLKKSRIICYISLAVVIVFGALNIILDPKDWVFSVAMFAIALVSTLVVLFVPVLYLKKAKTMPLIKNTYQFYPDKVNIITFSNNVEVTKAEWKYNIIKKIKELDNVLLLYLSNNQALIVDISKFADVNDKEILKKYISENTVSRETINTSAKNN